MKFNPLAVPMALSFPHRLTRVQSWQGLLPIAFALMQLHRPRVFVELGTHRGDSYCAFCQAVETLGLETSCNAVDTWAGDPQAGYYDDSIYDELRAYHDPLYSRFSRLIRGTFDEALAHFSPGSVDLLHIDGLHTYDAVRHDFESWLPKMSRRGVVLFHDISVRERDFGVWRLWEELIQRYPGRAFRFSNGLGVLAVGEALDEDGLGAWFATDEAAWDEVERWFNALGERVLGESRRHILEDEIHKLQGELADAGETMRREHEEWARLSEDKAGEIAALKEAFERETGLAARLIEEKETALLGALTERDALRNRLHSVEVQLLRSRRALAMIRDTWVWRVFKSLRRLEARKQRWMGRRGESGAVFLPAAASPAVSDGVASPMSSARADEPVPALDSAMDLSLDTDTSGAEAAEARGAALLAHLQSCITRSSRTLPGWRRALVPSRVSVDGVESRPHCWSSVEGGAALVFDFDERFERLKVVVRLAFPGAPVRVNVQLGLEDEGWQVERPLSLFPGEAALVFLRARDGANRVRVLLPSMDCFMPVQFAFVEVSAPEAFFMRHFTPLRRTLGLLRRYPNPFGKAWRVYRREGGVGGFLRVLGQRIGWVKPADAMTSPLEGGEASVFGYWSDADEVKRGEAPVVRRVAVGVSSLGNFFMREIARIVEGGFQGLGADVVCFDQDSTLQPQDFDWVVVVAPHEFFLLGEGVSWPAKLAGARNVLMLNTEQPQTQWFAACEPHLREARAVLDMSYQTALRLRASGMPAYFLPLGYEAGFEERYSAQALPEHEAFASLRACVRETSPASYAERPIDILFVGTISPRRERFFARHAAWFARYNVFIYLPDGSRPFVNEEARTLEFEHLTGLIRRSKIVLNVHRDEHPYLEWQRVVTLGILQKTLVVSDHCQKSPVIEANVDYVDGPLEALPALCEYYLSDPERARQFAEGAYARLREGYPMSRILRRLLAHL
ncbi:MAG: class I SAM-dependent methyltransferase [Halothiobacillaceae bacterium]|nr:class I SAM-dependent methyltransferase [Halothiobacillaceae bacterium]